MDARITSPITYGVTLLVAVACRRQASGVLVGDAPRSANGAIGADTCPQR
jgi:hypothetical protein